MNHFYILLVVGVASVTYGRPAPETAGDEMEAREGESSLIDGQDRAAEPRNPVLEYLRLQKDGKSAPIMAGTKREITHFEVFPRRQKIITAPPKTNLRQIFERNPNNSPIENFKGFILAGRRPEDNLVSSPVLTVNNQKKENASSSYTKVDVFPAIAVVINNYDENGRLRNSVTRYEPAGAIPSSDKTRQQITWPYAGYFPILIKDPFLSAFNSLATGTSFSFSSLIEYGPEADICRNRDTKTEQAAHVRNTRATKVSIADPDKGIASIRLEDPEGTREEYYKSDEIAQRLRNSNLILPPLSTILMPPRTGYEDRKKKPSKPSKPDKEESSEENVGEEHEESESPQDSSDGVAINTPPEGASVAEAKPVGLAIAGPGGVASAKPSGTAVVGPGGLAIARPVGTAIAGVEVEGSIPIGQQQQQQLKKPLKKKPKQELDTDSDSELKYVGGFSGPIGSPKPKHTPPKTNYIGGLRGVVGNPIPKHEAVEQAPADELYNTRRAYSNYQFKLGESNGKYGFLPFVPAQQPTARNYQNPTYFHGMLGAETHGMPASVYRLPVGYY